MNMIWNLIIINSCFRPCSVPLFGSMRANFYLQGKTLKGKKTYSTASLARAFGI
jgi:hypothetical protein